MHYIHVISVELFKILKDDAVKVLHSIYQQIWKIQQWPEDWKSQVFIPISKKGNAKQSSNYQILQDRLQQKVKWELPDVKVGFRKGRGTRDQIANIYWIIKKAKGFRKNICFIDCTKTFVWITTNCRKFLKR